MKSFFLLAMFSFLTSLLTAQNAKFTVFNQANTPVFTTNSFRQVAVGKNNSIWVGTANAGIYKFDGTSWVKGTVLLNNFVKGIVRNIDSSIVVGQAGYNAVNAITGGVNRFSGNDFTNQYWSSLSGGLPSRYVNSVCVSNNGTVWAGNGQDLTAGNTKEGGIAYLSPGATNFVKLTTGLPTGDIRIFTVACDTAELWAGIDRACPPGGCVDASILRYSLNGTYLGKYDATNTPIPFVTGGALVRAICFTKTHTAWVGLNTGGLAVLSGGTWTLVNNTNSKFPLGAAVNYNSMRSDSAGRVYIGTSLGLLVYNSGPVTNVDSYQLYTTANGLPSNNITGIEIYNTQIKWLTSAAGVVKMYDSFLPNPNGWQFSNGDENVWPISWYGQFSYTNDPYLGGGADFPKVMYSDGNRDTLGRDYYPDWPLFVEVLGEDQCYQTVAGVKVIKPNATAKYFSIIGSWGGSCFGFVQSSFMAWDSIERFKAKFPLVGPWHPANDVFDLPVNNANRKCINHMMTKQSQSNYYRYKATQNVVTPKQTLINVQQMLQDNSRNDKGLIIRNQNPGGGGHIVNPYRVKVDPANPNLQYIYIYDNNYPDDTSRKVTVDTTLDCWYYNLAANAGVAPNQWGGPAAHKGLYLSWPVRDWYNTTVLDSIAKSNEIDLTLPEENNIEVLNSPGSDILITNLAGQTTGCQADVLIENIPDAIPMVQETGTQQIPKGYYLPEAEYNIKLSNLKSPGVYLNVFNNSGNFGFSRTGASIDQEDLINVNYDGLLVNNSDSQAKIIDLTGNFKDGNNNMNIEIRKLGLSINGNSGLFLSNGSDIKLINTGAAAFYNLSLHFTGSNGVAGFKHDSIGIAANTAHIISPLWDSLQSSEVTVFIDNGINDSYEDTLYFGNTEPPQFLTYPTKLNTSSAASTDTVYLLNKGGSALNWTAVSSDTSWLKINGANTGTNNGNLIVSVLENPGGSRNGQINFSAVAASNTPYIIKVTQTGIINAPENLIASDGTFADGVHISWNAVPNATHYKIYRSANAGEYGIEITSWFPETEYIDSICNKGQFYFYSVKAAQDSTGLNATAFSVQDDGWRAGFTADFIYSGECSGQATSFTQKSTAHTKVFYLWDFNDDGTVDYTGKSFKHTFTAAGTYIVKLIVTDSIANLEQKIRTLTILPFPVLTMVSDTIACAGQPLTLNAGPGFFTYLWSTGASTASITVDSSGTGLGMMPVSVVVSANNACNATATTRVTWDTCSGSGSYNLSGLVTYDNIVSTALNNVTVMLKQDGSTVQQTTTDAGGNYSFTNLQAGVYQLTGSSDKAWGGVNSADALKTTRHFVGLITLQGVRMLAADVNGSAFINSVDALLIAKRFVGINNSFVVGDWAFAKDTVEIGSMTNQTANLKAVVYGDVDGSYFPPAKMEYGMELINKGCLFVDDPDDVEIPVNVDNDQVVGAMSIVVNLPSWIASINKVSINDKGNLLYHLIGDELRISWYSLFPSVLLAGDQLFTINCRLKHDECCTEKWQLDPSSQLADANGEPIGDVKITVPDLILKVNTFYLGQNIPNPFSAKSDLAWYMPEEGRVVLKVYDILGNEVRTIVESDFMKGHHTTIIDASDLKSGTYTYKMQILGKKDKFVQSKRFVLIK